MNEIALSDADFKKFSDLVYEKTGINLHYGKKQLLQSRANKILRKRDIPSYREYYNIIINDKSDQELMDFINLISTNVTHFFREEKHFQFLKEVWLNDFLSGNPQSVKIWSAACSSGEEPCSIAIALMEMLPEHLKNFSILATDISTKVLSMAKRGIYPHERVSNIPPALLRKYFLQGSSSAHGYVKIKNELLNLITFNRINLIEPFHNISSFDVIFCRNVMIYFDTPTKEMIVNKLFNHLKPGGYLFVGHSESLNGLNTPFQYIQPAVYRRKQ
jgi:chemotaxis protein methyltransferase CheR